MSDIHNLNLKQLAKQMRYVDELTMVVLKGHLVLEEQLERILATFVFHPNYLEDANLRFAQRVAIAQSMSLDEYANQMWDLIIAINALRNELAHTLNSEKRLKKFERVKSLYFTINTETTEEDRNSHDHEVVTYAVALALGFLGSFEEELIRFKEWVNRFDRVVNPHRHKQDDGGTSKE